MKKKFFYGITLISLLVIGGFGISLCFSNKELTIDEILETKAYSYLSPRVKEYIKEYYEETGKVLLTKEFAKEGETYLNPSYIEYLDNDNKEGYGVIPSVTAYTPKIVASSNTFPSSFDLRNVNGKNYVTPNKNQGNEGLCWAYATASLLETHDLIVKNKSYDSNAVLFSEKQIDYALSSNGIIGGNRVVPNAYHSLGEGGDFTNVEKYLSLRLLGVESSWTTNNNNLVSQNKPLEPSIVFNRDSVIYEVGETTRLSALNSDLSNTELNESVKNIIKDAVYNYGGAIIDVQVGNNLTINNILNKSDYINVVNAEYIKYSGNYHALHVVGWDDDYEYGFCAYAGQGYKGIHSFTTMVDDEITCNTVGPGSTVQKVTGKGAWILKNSWGNEYSYLYLTYDSFIDEVVYVNHYSPKDWDNNYNLTNPKLNFLNEGLSFVYSFDKFGSVNNEKLKKLKVGIQDEEPISIYVSTGGSDSNYTLIGSYSYDYAGYKEIDVEDRNIIINNNSKFKVVAMGAADLEVFTVNSDTNPSIYTYDYTYSIENEKPSSANYLNIDINSYVKNISDNTQITYKIKNNEDEYLPSDAYEVIYNRSYNGMVTPVVKLYSNYISKGTLYLDALKNNDVLNTSQLVFEAEFMPISGSGTSADPWQIENVRQFNMIRNANVDYYILKNDLDFEYDTHDPDGLFYNSGSGFNAMSFSGNLNGNGKTIKNIKVSRGLFDSVGITNECKFDTCGIHDLHIDNIEHSYATSSKGGIINYLSIKDAYNADVDNLTATNVVFNSNLSACSGGIAGTVSVNDYGSDWINTVIKINNWYSDVEFKGTQSPQGYDYHHIGGLIGRVYMISNSKMADFSLNNGKAHVRINLNNHFNKEYHVSDIIGGIENANGEIKINNVIGDLSYVNDNNANVTFNAFVGNVIKSGGTNRINGGKSTVGYYPTSSINITNYEAGLKPYEMATANYYGIKYYEDNYFVYDTELNGTTKVEFKDKFNIYGNKIPTLKSYPENYSEYYKTYSLRVGETKTINDLISNDTGYRKLHVYTSCEFNSAVCSNETEETIITAPTEANNYSFTGLKSGVTTLILYDELSGYLDVVIITVLNENEYILSLDYNYNNVVSNSFITKNTAYGNLPQLSRDGYTFKGWFTERENGTEIKGTDIFDGDSNITLYAHWEINKYTITFNSDGGSIVDSQEINYNEKVIIPDNPTKEGYTFKEWQLNGSLYDFDTLVTGNITLTAVYTRTEYTVTFNSDGGTSITSQKVNHNEKAIRPDNPTKTGYTFKEWQLNGSLYDFDTLVTGNITLTAIYTINKYTVTFNSDGGTSILSQTIDYNGKVEKPIDPTKEGYTFKEWQLNGSLYSFDTPVKDNITLTAVYKSNSLPQEDTLTSILTNNNYNVTDNYVSKIAVGTSISSIRSSLGSDVVVESNTTIISTGTVIRKGTESFTVVVKGDLTGDGRINSGDLLQMRKHLLEEVNLEGAYKQAGILESNGNIKSLDLLRLRQYLLGEYTFK